MAVTVGTPTFNTGSDGGTTFSHTVETGSDRLLYVSTSFRNGDVSGVTYDGVSMTELHNVNSPSGFNTVPAMRSYVLVNPPEGAHDVVVTGTGNSQATIALALFGVDQTTPHRTTNTHYNSDSSNPATSVTAASELDDLVLDSGRASPTDAPTLTEGSGQTVLVNSGAFNNRGRAFCSTKSGASPDVTMSWTWSTEDTANDRSVQGATSFIPASAGATEGTAAQTLPATTQALDGAVVPSGTVSQSLPALTQSASGSTGVDATGSASTTLPGLTQAAEGTSAVVGSLGITLAGGTFNIVPNSDNTMSGRRPLGEDTWDPNDPGTIAVVQDSASVNEDAGTITLSATRSGGTGAASVNWATVDGTAVDGTDYTSDSGTLNWEDLETGIKSAVITIIDRDGVQQGNTEFTWVLSGASGAEIRTDGGEPLDTTTVTINDQDTASENVSFIWRGDGSSGDFLQWHAIGDPDQFHYWRIPEYGRPVEWGGDGSLTRFSSDFIRGPNRPESFLYVCKNSVNGSEPDDCDVPNNTCTRRSSHMVFPAMHADYKHCKQLNEYFVSASVYIPSDGYWSGGTGWGPHLYGWKPALDADVTGKGSGFANISLDGPNNTWSFHSRAFHGQYTTDPDWSWHYHTKYRSDFPWDGGWVDAEDDAPNVTDTKAAFSNVNLDGWTDWIWHFVADHRGPDDSGTGFMNLWKREDNGPWVHVLQILPKNVTRGSLSWGRGVGFNVDGYYPSVHGLYMIKNKAWDAPNNWRVYMTNFNLYSSNSTFQGISDFLKAGS